MADFDKDRIYALLADLRSRDPSGPPVCLADLARRHRLDPMVVRRIAESEDVRLADGHGVPEEVDQDAPTGPIDVR